MLVSTRALVLAAVVAPLLALAAKRSAIIIPTYVVVSSTSVAEGDTGMTMFSVDVSLMGAVTPVEVDVSARGDPADESDFVFAPVHLTLMPGVPVTVSGFVLGDRRYERDERILVSAVVNGGTFGGVVPGVVTIVDDDQDLAPHVFAGALEVAEGNAGWWTLEVPVSLDRVLDTPLSISFQTSGGIPETPTRSWGDYRPAGGSVTFEPGQKTTLIPIEINGDSMWEADASFTIGLAPKDPAIVTTDSLTVTLRNDDAPTVVTIADVRTEEGQTGRHIVSLRASFDSPAPPYASVAVQVLGGTARAGEDFEGQTLRLVPPPGATSVIFAATIISDTKPECDEGVVIAYQASGTGDATMKEAKLLIADDDGAPDAGACPDPFATRSEPAPDAAAPATDALASDAPAEGPAPSSDGCGCGLAGGARASWPAVLALAALALRRRRPRR